MKLFLPSKPVLRFPFVDLDGQICLPRHLIPESMIQNGTSVDPERLAREFNDRSRYLSAVRVMEQKESDYITLVSSDGFEFIIARQIACQSQVLEQVLIENTPQSSLVEGTGNRIEFGHEFMRAPVLAKVCSYLQLRWRFKQDCDDILKLDSRGEGAMHLLYAADLLQL